MFHVLYVLNVTYCLLWKGKRMSGNVCVYDSYCLSALLCYKAEYLVQIQGFSQLM